MTLAEVLEARGGPLEEDEVWALLFTSAESLLDLFSIGKVYRPAVESCRKCGVMLRHILYLLHCVCFIFLGQSNICSIISPTSLLLSTNGTLAFKNCTMTDEACAFTAPEMLQGRATSSRTALEKVSISPSTKALYIAKTVLTLKWGLFYVCVYIYINTCMYTITSSSYLWCGLWCLNI